MVEHVSFWHLSDLHLDFSYESDVEARPSDFKIKRDLLGAIARELEHMHAPPQMLLLTGDLLECEVADAPRVTPALEPLLAAARQRHTEIYGIPGSDKHDTGLREIASQLGWDWLMKTGEVRHHPSGIEIHAVAEATDNAVQAAVRNLPEPKAPSILLAHTGEVARRTPHNYRALGHVHTPSIVCVDENHQKVSGRPGHLFSYWDGSGKAWPVCIIAGTISVRDGYVKAWRVPLEASPFFAPSTRQIYGDVGGYEKKAGSLYLVHAPTERFFYEDCGLDAECVEFLPRTGAVKATYRFTSKDERDNIVRKVLSACATDVFVAPSSTGKFEDRLVVWGRACAENEEQFTKFVKHCFVRSESTQTSDKSRERRRPS